VIDPLLGRQLGRYELRAFLGAGGMARVYHAFDHILERDLALKILYAKLQHTDFAERFRREARILAGLRHPNIMPIYDYGQFGDLEYIAQQLQPGPTLESELASLAASGRRMERAMLQQVIAQLADALDYAHSHNVIHRDLKPSNTIRNERGDVILTDFGIAKSLIDSPSTTLTGWVLGTPAYLSPEQVRSLTLSPASDIYALGVILFEILTGQVPFNDPRPMEVLLAHIQQPPPSLRSLRPDLPPAVEHVIFRALAKNPAERYTSAGALAQALISAWPATPIDSVHSMPTALNRAPLATFSQPAGETVHLPLDRATIRRTFVAKYPSASAPPRRGWGRAILVFMTLPILLLLLTLLFFIGQPEARPPVYTLATAIPSSELDRAAGFATPMLTPTPTTLALTHTTTPAPTATASPAPIHTATPAPTLTSTSASTLGLPTTTPQPPALEQPPAPEHSIPEAPAPEPPFEAPDF
jgi:eukaryotic-like serine/threonine-protein kinase